VLTFFAVVVFAPQKKRKAPSRRLVVAAQKGTEQSTIALLGTLVEGGQVPDVPEQLPLTACWPLRRLSAKIVSSIM
jgi:hypothetical protein